MSGGIPGEAIRISRHIDAATLAGFGDLWKKAGGYEKIFTEAEAKTFASLARQGWTPESFRDAWVQMDNTGMVGKDLEYRRTLPVALAGELAGKTPLDHAVRMSRAGIPISQFKNHRHDPDWWESGRKYRDEYEADRARLNGLWGRVNSMSEWPWTRSTYLTGEVNHD